MKYQTALVQGTSPRIGAFTSRVILFVIMTVSEVLILKFEEIY
jgi:hypothetical protein